MVPDVGLGLAIGGLALWLDGILLPVARGKTDTSDASRRSAAADWGESPIRF